MPARLGTLTTNAQGYLRIPIGVGLSVLLLGETVPANLALGLVLVMAGVAAMTIPGDQIRKVVRAVARPAEGRKLRPSEIAYTPRNRFGRGAQDGCHFSDRRTQVGAFLRPRPVDARLIEAVIEDAAQAPPPFRGRCPGRSM